MSKMSAYVARAFVLGAVLLSCLPSAWCAPQTDGPDNLMIAVAKGNASAVERFLTAGDDPNKRYKGLTPLYMAATGGDAVVTRLLLAHGADPNRKNDNGSTALMQSVYGGNPEVAQALLEKGADPNAGSKRGNTPLLYAAYVGASDPALLTKLLSAQGTSPAVSGEQIAKMQVGAFAIVTLLLAHHADANARDTDGRTALMQAALGGNVGICQTLLHAGANPNLHDKNGAYALGFAAANGHAETAAVLLSGGADMNAKDSDGKTALMLASEARHGDVVKVLEEAGATQIAHVDSNSAPPALTTPQAQAAQQQIQAVYVASDGAFARKDLTAAFAYIGPNDMRQSLQKQMETLLPRIRSLLMITHIESVSSVGVDGKTATLVAAHHMEANVINPSTGEPGIFITDERDAEGWAKTAHGWRKQHSQNLSVNARFEKQSAPAAKP